MAKKFFYNRVYNTRRMIINGIIIGVCIIGVIICFILTSNFQAENKEKPKDTGNLIIKDAIVEINEQFTNEIFFSKIENVELDQIKVNFPDDYDIGKVGKYSIVLEIDGKKYDTTLEVVDTTKPNLVLKNLDINENDQYNANSFVDSCNDNSNKNCTIKFYGLDEEGKEIDYSSYKTAGTYTVKIVASDESGNQTVEETKLNIKSKTSTEQPTQPQEPVTPSTCKYGDNNYDSDNYLLAVDITTNGCGISLDLYKDSKMTSEINKIMDQETTRIKKDVNALNLNFPLALNRKVTAVMNTSGSGIVGYELQITITINKNDKVETIVEYKLDKNGKRVFTQNPYNLEQ